MIALKNLSSRQFANQFAVLGLSRSGLASVEALTKAGAKTFGYDDNIKPDLGDGAIFAPPEQWPWGDLEAVIISPGIPHRYPAPHPAAAMAAEHGVDVISDIELLLKAEPQAKLIGITGTNGKSTVVSLLKHIFDYHSIPAALGGNIGIPALALDDTGKDGVIILELSSYQLETTPSLSSDSKCFDVGAVINITPDHLDRHGGWEGYVAAKTRLAQGVKADGLLVLGDSARGLAEATSAQVKIARADDNAIAPPPNLKGPHNAVNIAIAAGIAEFCGLTPEQVAESLPHFKALPHRMEQVGTWGQISFINDSKATNGEAAAEALKSFEKIYWIAGGLAKDDGLKMVKDHLSQVKCAYLIGSSAKPFAEQLAGACRHQISETLEVATAAAFQDAACDSADQATVLLSPAAASFDQFDNFEERGEKFCQLVNDLLAKHPSGGQSSGGRHV